MEFTRKIALVALAAGVLGASAACTGSSSGSTSAGGTSSASATQASATASTGASTQPTSTASASAPSTGSNTQPASATSSCTGADLKTSLGRTGAATGHDIVTLVFTNTSSQTCTLQGYPGAAVTSGSTIVLNAIRTLNGYAGDERQLTSAPLVTLAPHATASANLEWVVDNGEPCVATGNGTLEVTPPNTKTTTGLEPLTTGTKGICADFEVHPVVAGTL